jgi:hypothetical protein
VRPPLAASDTTMASSPPSLPFVRYPSTEARHRQWDLRPMSVGRKAYLSWPLIRHVRMAKGFAPHVVHHVRKGEVMLRRASLVVLVLAAARWHRQHAGVVPDHGVGRPKNHPVRPDCWLSGCYTATKLAYQSGSVWYRPIYQGARGPLWGCNRLHKAQQAGTRRPSP